VGGSADVVFEHDDAVVLLKDLCDAFGDVALEVDVFRTFHDGHALQCTFFLDESLKAVQFLPHMVDFLPRLGVFPSIGKDVEFGLGCQGVAHETFEGLEHVVCSVIDKEGDRG
jgi:hypothetical protein